MLIRAEIWVPVVGYEGLYEVSDLGAVRSLSRRVGTSNGGWRLTPTKELRPCLRSGYPSVVLFKEGKRKRVAVHRLVLETFVGPCPAGAEACHENGRRDDPRLVNLRWDTRRANQADRVRHGTSGLYGRRLNPDEAAQILAERGHISQVQLAKQFGVALATVNHIHTGRNWKRLHHA